jgi:predicted DNA-binding protein (UPF0251 family)
MKMRYRRGWQGRGRPPKPISLEEIPSAVTFRPSLLKDSTPVHLLAPELEAMRLVDGEGFEQETAGKRMGISRGSIWRLLQSGRQKVVIALTQKRPLELTVEDTSTTPQNGIGPGAFPRAGEPSEEGGDERWRPGRWRRRGA